jgi:hypothetical protein
VAWHFDRLSCVVESSSPPEEAVQRLVEWATAMIDRLRGVEVPMVEEHHWVREGEHFALRTRLRPEWLFLVDPVAAPDIASMPTYQAALAALSHTQLGPRLGNLVGTDRGWSRYDVGRVTVAPLCRILEANAQPQEAALYDAFHSAVHAGIRPHVRRVIFAPVLGLASELDSVQLPNNVCLRRLSDDEIVRCIEAGIIPTDRHFAGPVPTHAVACEIHEPVQVSSEGPSLDEQQSSNSTDPAEALLRVGMALRLATPVMTHLLGVVDTADAGHDGHSLLPWTSYRRLFVNRRPMLLLRTPEQLYQLDESSAVELAALASQLQSPGVERRRFLGTALRRFSSAQDELADGQSEDALLDLMIAAEAVFLTDITNDGYRGELRFRLALRAAAFIDEAPRRSTFRLMKLAYDVRSKIVHGAEVASAPPGYNGLVPFVGEVADRLRLGLRQYAAKASETLGKGSVLEPDEALLRNDDEGGP